jgi:hypothetical protein
MAEHDREMGAGQQTELSHAAVRAVQGNEVELDQSAVFVARGQEMEFEQSAVFAAIARSITLDQSAAFIVLAPRVVGAARALLTLHGLVGLVVGFALARWLAARSRTAAD